VETIPKQSAFDAWSDRAGRASTDLEAHRALEGAKVELRDSLVVEGIDTGRSVGSVARACHISTARVTQILARRG
jgi:hypothetical protein